MWTTQLLCSIVLSTRLPNRAERNSLMCRDEASSLLGMVASTTAKCLSLNCAANSNPAQPMLPSSPPPSTLGHRLFPPHRRRLGGLDLETGTA